MKIRIGKGILITFLIFNSLNSIPITNADPTVMVTSYTLEPETLLPGDSAELTIILTNTESTATKTETDYINNQAVEQTIKTIAAELVKVWIVEDGDGTNTISAEKIYSNIGDLSPGSSISLSFKITADINITEGLYYPTLRVDVENYQDVKYPFPIRIDNLSVNLLQKDVPSKMICFT